MKPIELGRISFLYFKFNLWGLNIRYSWRHTGSPKKMFNKEMGRVRIIFNTPSFSMDSMRRIWLGLEIPKVNWRGLRVKKLNFKKWPFNPIWGRGGCSTPPKGKQKRALIYEIIGGVLNIPRHLTYAYFYPIPNRVNMDPLVQFWQNFCEVSCHPDTMSSFFRNFHVLQVSRKRLKGHGDFWQWSRCLILNHWEHGGSWQSLRWSHEARKKP